ncbi:MAG: ABC transporter ATP-binding protein [Armatimonadetes bacterium]|nr:ABC transporter ATP-binding protein [Armatimonadota bacterium]
MNWLKRRIDERIWSEIVRQKRMVIAGLLCSAGAAALLGVTALLIKELIGLVEDKNKDGLMLLAAGVVVVFGVRYFLARGQIYLLGKAAARLGADMRIRLFEKIQRLPVSYFNEKRSGSIQSTLTNDVNVFQIAVGSVRDAIDGPLKILIGVGMVFYFQWQLALVAILVFPVMAKFIQSNARKMKTAQSDVQESLGTLTAMMHEQLAGTRIVKAFGAEKAVTGKFAALVDSWYERQAAAIKRMSKLRPMVEFLGATALAVTLVVCGYLVVQGSLELPDLIAFLYSLDIINQGFRNLGQLNQTLAQVQAATDRIYEEVLDASETMGDAPDAREIASPEGRIEFKNVSFSYPDGTKALDNVSFSIEPGTSLALVGPSGAGKSTVADLLLRFYDPTDGQILFDGVDIRELKGQWYRSQIGVVPQQTFLFAGSISENLRLGKPDATDEEIQGAARAAHADVFIDATDDRYETELGERGVRLSGGEGQRLAIARAIIRQPKLLLLDEATSNLDAHSESLVTEALDEIMNERTTLLIAHRLTTASRATRIVMLQQGVVVETGSHTELMAKGGAYATMYRAFTSGVMNGGIA